MECGIKEESKRERDEDFDYKLIKLLFFHSTLLALPINEVFIRHSNSYTFHSLSSHKNSYLIYKTIQNNHISNNETTLYTVKKTNISNKKHVKYSTKVPKIKKSIKHYNDFNSRSSTTTCGSKIIISSSTGIFVFAAGDRLSSGSP